MQLDSRNLIKTECVVQAMSGVLLLSQLLSLSASTLKLHAAMGGMALCTSDAHFRDGCRPGAS